MVDLHLFLGRPLKEAQKDSQAQDDGLIGTVPQQFVDDEQNFVKAAHDKSHDLVSDRDRIFPSSPGPLFQSEAKYKTIDLKTSFNFHGNKTHFHKKGFALSLVLKKEFLELGNDLLTVRFFVRFRKIFLGKKVCP